VRVFKEFFVLGLLALIGATSGWWCLTIFGAKATGELLKYGGAAAGLFLVAARLVAGSFDRQKDLDRFDHITRENFSRALRDMQTRFRWRMVAGVVIGALTAAAGILLVEFAAEGHPGWSQALSLAGSAGLLVTAVMGGAQIWAATWPSQYLSAAKRQADAEKIHRKRLEAYGR